MRMKTLALAFAASVAFAGPSGAVSLIQNGSFEDLVAPGDPAITGYYGQNFNTLGTGGGNRDWDVYKTLPGGWYTNTAVPAGFEVQTNPTLGDVNAQDGTHYVELESDPANPSISTLLQKFDVAVAGYYTLSFFYQPRVNTAGENVVNAVFDGLSTAVSGPPVPAFGTWTQIFVTKFLTAGVGKILEFNAVGTADNTLGGFIDNVSVEAYRPGVGPEIPLPAGLILLLTGLGGLGFLGRSRSKVS